MARKTKKSKSKLKAVPAAADADDMADVIASELGFSDDAAEFLAAVQEDEAETEEPTEDEADALPADELAAQGSELEDFETAEIEDVLTISEEEIVSVVESLLFSTEKPMTPHTMKAAFAGTKIRVADIRRALDQLRIEYASANRGVIVEEVAGGYQLRTKPDNMKYLRQTVKARPFKLSGPALEVLSIVAYKQPCPKAMVDEVRGVESGHLMRGLLERGLIRFGEKSDLPGRPMLYETSKKFLEIFGLRNLNELPSLSEIDQILPEGMDETDEKKETLSDLTGRLSEEIKDTYSEGEEELTKITDELQTISTSSEFFEQEKQRQKEKREADRAQDIRERMLVGEDVSTRDRNWLERYELSLLATTNPPVTETDMTVSEGMETTSAAEVAETAGAAEIELAAETELAAEAATDTELEMSPDMPTEFVEEEVAMEAAAETTEVTEAAEEDSAVDAAVAEVAKSMRAFSDDESAPAPGDRDPEQSEGL